MLSHAATIFCPDSLSLGLGTEREFQEIKRKQEKKNHDKLNKQKRLPNYQSELLLGYFSRSCQIHMPSGIRDTGRYGMRVSLYGVVSFSLYRPGQGWW